MIRSNDTNLPEEKHKLWDYPWKYTESFIIALEIMVMGFLVEMITGGKGIVIPGIPVNIYIIFIFFSILLFLHLQFKDKGVIIWLSSIPAAISAISVYALLVLLMGFIPQHSESASKFLQLTGLNHIKSCWAFVLLQFYFLTALGMVILRRAIPFRIKNLGFILNHFGLWITLLAAGMGSSDLKRLTINLLEDGKRNNLALASNGEMYRMPFSLQLIDFDVVQYDPKLVVMDVETGKVVMGDLKILPFVHKGLELKLMDWMVKVEEYIPQALYIGDKFQSSDSVGSNPAALVTAIQPITKDTIRGWLTSGSFSVNPSFLLLHGRNFLALTPPEPQKFSSKMVVFKDSTAMDTVILEVNKPYTIEGWKIYQTGYDENKGKWSTLSVLEAIHDPWLPIVYFGMMTLLCGAFYLFWIGKDKKEKTY